MPDIFKNPKSVKKSLGSIDSVIRTNFELSIDGLPEEIKSFLHKHYPEIDLNGRIDTLACNCGCGGGNCKC